MSPKHSFGFHPNPQVARSMDKSGGQMGKVQNQSGAPSTTGGADPAHHVTIHHPNSPDHPSPGSGSFHTTTMHSDGNEEHADHTSAGEAADHAKMALGDDGDADDGMDDTDEIDEGDVKRADDGAY